MVETDTRTLKGLPKHRASPTATPSTVSSHASRDSAVVTFNLAPWSVRYRPRVPVSDQSRAARGRADARTRLCTQAATPLPKGPGMRGDRPAPKSRSNCAREVTELWRSSCVPWPLASLVTRSERHHSSGSASRLPSVLSRPSTGCVSGASGSSKCTLFDPVLSSSPECESRA
eukprot:4998919-Prymnesium_polylepis.1